jgi:hypothetical protein
MNSPVILWVLVLVMDGDISEHKTVHTRAECLSIGRMILSDPETPFDGFFCDKVPSEPVTHKREIPKCLEPAENCS